MHAVSSVAGSTIHATGEILGATVNATGKVAGATLNTTGKIVSGTVNAAGNIVGGTVNAVGNIGGSKHKGNRFVIPPEVHALVKQVLIGDSLSPFSAWDDFSEWLEMSSDITGHSSTLIYQHMQNMTSDKSVNEGLHFLALCLNTKRFPSKNSPVMLKLSVSEYEKNLAKLPSEERKSELIAIMLCFCKLCEMFDIQ